MAGHRDQRRFFFFLERFCPDGGVRGVRAGGAGVPLPFIDYRVGPFGEGQGPGGGQITIEAPGFNDPDAFGQ